MLNIVTECKYCGDVVKTTIPYKEYVRFLYCLICSDHNIKVTYASRFDVFGYNWKAEKKERDESEKVDYYSTEVPKNPKI